MSGNQDDMHPIIFVGLITIGMVWLFPSLIFRISFENSNLLCFSTYLSVCIILTVMICRFLYQFQKKLSYKKKQSEKENIQKKSDIFETIKFEMKVIDELIEKKNTELAINKIDNLKPLMINAYGTALFDKSHKKQDWLVNRLRSSEEKIIRCNIEIAASHINNSRNFREKKQFAEVRKELELSNRHINISIKISKEYLFKELFSISLYYIQIINDEYNLLEREIQLEKANIAIVRNQFDDAIKIYSGFNMDEKVKELKLRKAKMFEDSMKYDAAVEIFDELGLTSEAARVRKLIARSRVPITKIEIETIDQSIQISDSVILRSNIGTKNEVPSPKI